MGGLSPRVRGNPLHTCCCGTGPRSIPACTGKPSCCASSACGIRVYPRVYGETRPTRSWKDGFQGLSPRVRGNRGVGAASSVMVGSIPACTGKPLSTPRITSRAKVYPRVYGETDITASFGLRGQGLSPRVRGNQAAHQRRHRGAGSIPACTGKPRLDISVWNDGAVYPRVYGETILGRSQAGQMSGLSPRVRGNPAALPG